MGKTADKATRQAKEGVAALLSEPLIDIAMVNRCGVMGQITRETLENIGEGVLGGELPGTILGPDHVFRDGAKLAKIPPAFMFAVTASKVHMFEVKFFMGNVKVKDEIATFDRAGLELASQEDTLVVTYRMSAPQQRQEMMFEVMKSDYARDVGTLIRSGTPITL
jgi:hypothetical protein